MGWAESTPLVEIRVTDLQKSGGEWGLLPMLPWFRRPLRYVMYVSTYLYPRPGVLDIADLL